MARARGDPRRACFPGSLVGPIFADQIEVTIRHHALESGCFVVNATGWLTDEQIAQVAGDTGLERALRGGCFTAIVSPEGMLLAPPLTEGEGMVIADLDLALDHQAQTHDGLRRPLRRPELLWLLIDRSPQPHLRALSKDGAPAMTSEKPVHAPILAARDAQPATDVPARDSRLRSRPSCSPSACAGVTRADPGSSRRGGAGPSDHKAVTHRRQHT